MTVSHRPTTICRSWIRKDIAVGISWKRSIVERKVIWHSFLIQDLQIVMGNKQQFFLLTSREADEYKEKEKEEKLAKGKEKQERISKRSLSRKGRVVGEKRKRATKEYQNKC